MKTINKHPCDMLHDNYISKELSESDDIIVDIPLTALDVYAIGRICSGFRIMPKQEILSHKNFYYVVKTLITLEINYTDILSVWQISDGWSDLTDTEYTVMTAVLDPNVITMRLINRAYSTDHTPRNNIVQIMVNAVVCSITENDANLIIKVQQFVNTAEFLDDATQNRMNDAKKEMHHLFNLNPFVETFKNYFTYQIPTEVTYSCADISRYPAYIDGDATMVSREVFDERWDEVSFGVFDKSPNTRYEGDFPWNAGVVAGGVLTRILTPNFKNSNNFDIDIFILGKDKNERIANMQQILKWFDCPNAYFSIMGSVVSVYIIGCPRMFQIVSNDKSTAYEVITAFDATHLQFAFMGGNVICTAAAMDANKHMCTTPTAVGIFNLSRFIKALYNGYDIAYNAIYKDNDMFDLSHLTNDPKNNHGLKNTIAGFYKYWMPCVDESLDDNERDMYIKEEIKLHAVCTIVVSSATEVMKHITVGGNFELDYAASNFRSFDFSSVKMQRRRNHTFDIQNHIGIIRLTSDIIVISEIVDTADGMRVICDVERGSEFETFLNSLDQVLYRMFSLAAPTLHALDKGKVAFDISTRVIDTQTANEISILKNQHDEPMAVTELKAEQQMRVLFKIHINTAPWNPTHNGVTLEVCRMTKYDDEEEDGGNNSDFSDSDED